MKLIPFVAALFMSGSVFGQGTIINGTGVGSVLQVQTPSQEILTVDQLLEAFTITEPFVFHLNNLVEQEEFVVRLEDTRRAKTVGNVVLNDESAIATDFDYAVDAKGFNGDWVRLQYFNGTPVAASVCRCTSANGGGQTGTCTNTNCDNVDSCGTNNQYHCNWRASRVPAVLNTHFATHSNVAR